MFNTTDKTIPFRLTDAEYENLRILRKRTQPSQTADGLEAEESMEMAGDAAKSDVGQVLPEVKPADVSQ